MFDFSSKICYTISNDQRRISTCAAEHSNTGLT